MFFGPVSGPDTAPGVDSEVEEGVGAEEATKKGRLVVEGPPGLGACSPGAF